MGAETGGTNQAISPQLQKIMTRVAPVMVFACSTKVSSVSFSIVATQNNFCKKYYVCRTKKITQEE